MSESKDLTVFPVIFNFQLTSFCLTVQVSLFFGDELCRADFVSFYLSPDILGPPLSLSHARLASFYEREQDLSISQSILRLFADKLLSSRHQAPDFLFVFLGHESTNKVAERAQDCHLIHQLVLGTIQNSITKDGFSTL